MGIWFKDGHQEIAVFVYCASAIDQVDVAGIPIGVSSRGPGSAAVFEVDVGDFFLFDKGRGVQMIVPFISTKTQYRFSLYMGLEVCHESHAFHFGKLP